MAAYIYLSLDLNILIDLPQNLLFAFQWFSQIFQMAQKPTLESLVAEILHAIMNCPKNSTLKSVRRVSNKLLDSSKSIHDEQC